MPSHCTTSSDNCIGCGTCILVCPKRLLILDNGRPKMIEGREHLCNDCGQCTAYCPEGAAIHNGILAADLEKTSMPSSSASKTISRNYKTGDGTGDAGFLHFGNHLRKDSFGRRGSENDEKFLFNIGQVAKN